MTALDEARVALAQACHAKAQNQITYFQWIDACKAFAAVYQREAPPDLAPALTPEHLAELKVQWKKIGHAEESKPDAPGE